MAERDYAYVGDVCGVAELDAFLVACSVCSCEVYRNGFPVCGD